MNQMANPGYSTGAQAAEPYRSAAGTGYAITHGPAATMVRIDVTPGQTLIAEAGSMVAKHVWLDVKPKFNARVSGGIFGWIGAIFIAILRKVIGGETFFVNHYTANHPGSVWLAPPLAGQIAYRRLQGESMVLSAGAFLASVGDVNIRLKWGGLRMLFAREGFFQLEVTGNGDLWYTSYGGIHAIDVNGSFMVDTGHLVGFEGPLQMTIRSAGGGLMGLFASGEGLVCEFTGQGRIYIQSRNEGALLGWLIPQLP